MSNTPSGLSVNGHVEALGSTVEVINIIATSQQSGCLVFSPEDGRRYLCFQGGALVGAASERPLEGLGAFLLREGVPRAKLEAIEADVGGHMGARLERHGIDEVEGLLTRYIAEIVCAVLAIKKGTFQLRPQDAAAVPPFAVNVQAVMMEGLYCLDEAERYKALIPDRFTRLGRAEASPAALDAPQRRVWEALEAPTYIEKLGQRLHLDELAVTKIAFELVQRGALEVLPDSAEESSARSLSQMPKAPEPLPYLFDVDALWDDARPAPKRTLCPACLNTYSAGAERCPHDSHELIPDRSGQVVLERYTLRSLLGVGGMGGAVWEGRQLTTGRPVAIKLFPPSDEEEIGRFARGARLASHLNNPHITTVHDYGQDEDGTLVLIMELLEGEPLSMLLADLGALPIERALNITNQVLRALEAAHRHRAVHRDLKPENLFLIPENGDDYIKVNDFGLAKYEEGVDLAEVTTTRKICGTPKYMAPEQIVGDEVDARTDLYAVGVILFRMVTGRLPFREGDTHTLFRQILTQPAPRLAEVVEHPVPERLEVFVAQALEKDAEKRFSSARSMRMALNALRLGMGFTVDGDDSQRSISLTEMVDPLLVSQAMSRRGRGGLIAALLLAGVIGAGIIYALSQGPAPQAPPPPTVAAAPEITKASLLLESEPAGAAVKLEGMLMGRAPLGLELPVGEHAFELGLQGHAPVSVLVEVKRAGVEMQRTVTLTPLPAPVDAAAPPPSPTPPAPEITVAEAAKPRPRWPSKKKTARTPKPPAAPSPLKAPDFEASTAAPPSFGTVDERPSRARRRPRLGTVDERPSSGRSLRIRNVDELGPSTKK